MLKVMFTEMKVLTVQKKRGHLLYSAFQFSFSSCFDKNCFISKYFAIKRGQLSSLCLSPPRIIYKSHIFHSSTSKVVNKQKSKIYLFVLIDWLVFNANFSSISAILWFILIFATIGNINRKNLSLWKQMYRQ